MSKQKPAPKETTKMSNSVKQLADLAARQSRSVVAVIDALSVRGSFKGEELATIGMLRDQSAQISALAEAVASEIATEESVVVPD